MCGNSAANRLHINSGIGTFTNKASDYNVELVGQLTFTSLFVDVDFDGDLDVSKLPCLCSFCVFVCVRREAGFDSPVHPNPQLVLAQEDSRDTLFLNAAGTLTDVSEAYGFGTVSWSGSVGGASTVCDFTA